MTKTCSICQVDKNISDFHIDKKGSYGVKSICKECRKRFRYREHDSKKKLGKNIALGIIRALKNNKSNSYFKFFDFSLLHLKQHFESYFDEEINWNTFCISWGIDFIIPRKYFKFSDLSSTEFKKCFSLRNMRPMKINDLRKKQGRMYWEDIEKFMLFDYLPVGSIAISGENIGAKNAI